MNTRKISDALTLSSPRKKATDAGEEAIVYNKKSPTNLKLSSPRKKEYDADSCYESFEEKKSVKIVNHIAESNQKTENIPEETMSEESKKAFFGNYIINSMRRGQASAATNQDVKFAARENIATQQLINQSLIENNNAENKNKKTRRNCFGK